MKKIFLLLLSCILLIDCGGDGGDSGGSERLLYSFSQGSAGFFYNPPTFVNDYIYIGTSRGCRYDVASDNYFFKLNSNLTKVWEYPLGNKQVRGGATLDSAGNIYFVVEEGYVVGTPSGTLYLYSLDNNGSFRWSKEIASYYNTCGMSNPAIAVDNTIYVGGVKFYAFNINGDVLWTYGNNMITANAPIIDLNGNIYFSTQGAIISLDSNGTQRWIFLPTIGGHLSSPAFSVDYSKIFVPVETTVYCVDASTGSKIWEITPSGISGEFRATPAVDNNNNVYIGTHANVDSVFYAIKADGSGILWKNKIGADLYSSPALGNDNTVYVGSEWTGGPLRLHALNMSTGNVKWSASLGADATFSSPAISDKGILYIASMDYLGSGGGVYAFRTDSTGLLPGAGSPRFHGGNANTGRRE